MAVVLGITAFGVSAFGQVTLNGFGNTPNAWPSSSTAPTSFVGTDPVVVSGTGTTSSGGAPPSGTVSETVGAGKVESETLLAPASFTLGAVSFVLSGATHTSADMSIHLFQLQHTTGSSSGYDLSTAQVGSDLLGGGSGEAFQFNGSASNEVVEFDFAGTDQVSLTSGTEYVFEIWNTSTNTLFMERVSAQPYLGGQAYMASGIGAQQSLSTVVRGGVSGAGARDLLFAVYPVEVPEPTSFGLLCFGLATMSLLARQRPHRISNNEGVL